MAAQKQYLIEVPRLSFEVDLSATTDQPANKAYYIVPDGQSMPDPAILQTPLRSGLTRYTGNLSGQWSNDCSTTPPPVDSGAPVFVNSWTPPQWNEDDEYYVEFNTDDATLITPATGKTITYFQLMTRPDFFPTLITSSSQSSKKFFISVHIPKGTTEIPFTIRATQSDGKTTERSFKPTKKSAESAKPYVGVSYSSFDKFLQVFVGPLGNSLPTISYVKYPAGYANIYARSMPEYGTNPLAILDNREAKYRELTTNPPSGTYTFKLIHNGFTVYGTYVLTGASLSYKVDLSDTPPDGVTPTINPPVWTPFPTQNARGGETFTMAIPNNQVAYGAGQSFQQLSVSGIPDMVIVTGTSSDYAVQWAVPSTYPPGTYQFKILIKQTDGQTAETAVLVNVIAAPFYVQIVNESSTVDIVRLGPTFTNATIEIDGPGSFVDVAANTPMTEFDTGNIAGRTYMCRYRGRKFNVPGFYIFTFKQDGVTLYASLITYADFTGTVDLTLSSTKPVRTETLSYRLDRSGDSADEGSSAWIQLSQQAAGQPWTPTSSSGLRYGSDNARTGTVINELTGAITIASNSNVNDGYVLTLWAKLNNTLVATTGITINDKTQVNIIQQILKVQTKRVPGPASDSNTGIWLRVKTANNYVARFSYSDGGAYLPTSQMNTMFPFVDGEYQYGNIIHDDPVASGIEYITVGFVTSAGAVAQFTINKAGTDADWVTQYDGDTSAPVIPPSANTSEVYGAPRYFTTDSAA